MLQALIAPLTEIVGGIVRGKVEQRAAETRAKVAKAEAEAQIMLSAATSEAEWERVMAQGSQQSWKDEWLTILFSIPLMLSFCGEWGRTITENGFAALETMPDWYQYTVGVIVAASFGVRSAVKFFGGNK